MSTNHRFTIEDVLDFLTAPDGDWDDDLDAWVNVKVDGATAVMTFNPTLGDDDPDSLKDNRESFRVSVERTEDDPGAMTAEEQERFPALASLEHPAITARFADDPTPLTDEQVAQFAELIDMHRQYGPALSIEGEAQLLVEVLRLRALTGELQGQLDAIMAVRPLPTRPNATRITLAGAKGHALALADIRRAVGRTPEQIHAELEEASR